ncbi:predicted protein [Thalassiosira pseudonana CCMP1335]|jgi:hypothetical protein|uniref:Uncharacterized protein n=1 Tax=Thalassiosira pseudonana TaxID=35128 RepID=B8C0B5_THAPS|nr:predicted protein [Thalassiosira pseudonana CCMP1335]EED93035.1 predicted protein [Thalassiosira pseudonana CCMP1335]|mmetsp:Transcript_17157/g.37217  ORF Transcript_17157/g.37217 Transcript_17157/m.37217 type:complete len:135 (-) Transcript_17157:130-534(-)|eukprot:g11770.t1 g11770   contig6:562713-563117(-)
MINQTIDENTTLENGQLSSPIDGASDDEVEVQGDNGYNKDVWDEGGRSDCGYSDSVHDTLMTIGEKFYSVLGEPSEVMQTKMKGIGSYFMELSYAARDLRRGEFGKRGGVGIENEDDDSSQESEVKESDVEAES